MKNFNNDKELLSAYIDGELSQEEKKYIEEKIKSSLELQKLLGELKRLKDLTSNSFERVADSPFFETRVMAAINQDTPIKFKFRKWVPVVILSALTVGLMLLLKFNPHLINNLIETQKSNIAGFYKENLQPLLYTADLSNEDIYNFAMFQQLPLDSSKQQVLKFGYDPQGREFFEIKKLDNVNKTQPADNLQKFVSALNLNHSETEQMDSIIESYSDELSSLILVNDKNSVAINPSLWNTRNALLADIISFAQTHAPENFKKIVPAHGANFNLSSIAEWVNESKKIKDDQYIFITQDSIFKDDFQFDMSEFKKNMSRMERDLKKLSEEQKNSLNFTFSIDTAITNKNYKAKLSEQCRVFVDSNLVKVTVQNISIPDFNMQNFQMPDFDSIAVIINEATKNLKIYIPSIPEIQFNSKDYQPKQNSGKYKKNKRVEVNLDSLLNLKNIIADSIRSEQIKKFENLSDSLSKNFNVFPGDSLILRQNNELKKEMDNLRKELKKFREEMKNYENKGDEKNQNNFREIRNGGIKKIHT